MNIQNIDFGKLKRALEAIDEGFTKKLEIDKDLKVYAVGENVIRIDIKK